MATNEAKNGKKADQAKAEKILKKSRKAAGLPS